MRFRMLAVAVAVIVLQVSVASRISEAGHRDVRRHVNTKPGVHAGYVNSQNGSVRTRGLSSLSGYGFSRSRRVHRPRQRLHRHVPVTSFSFVSSPYRHSSYGYSPHGFSSYRSVLVAATTARGSRWESSGGRYDDGGYSPSSSSDSFISSCPILR